MSKLKSKKLEENAEVINFLMERRKLAYDIDELRTILKMPGLTDEQLQKERDVEYRYIETYKRFFYIYKHITIQFQETLDLLVKEGKIKEQIIDGVKMYSAIDWE